MQNEIKNKKRIILYTTIIFIAIFLLLYLVFLKNIKEIKTIEVSNEQIIDLSNFYYDIKKNESENDNQIIIEGFIYDKNSPIDTSAIKLLLENNNEFYEIPTYVKYIENNMVNNINYCWSGFVSYIDKNRINIDINYEIYILTVFNDETKIVKTNKYIKDLINK